MAGGGINEENSLQCKEISTENPLQCKGLTELRKTDKKVILGLQAKERGVTWRKRGTFWILIIYCYRKGLQI